MKALLAVSFGTSREAAKVKGIDAIEDALRAEFSDWAFYSAWTSPRIIEKVKRERGEHHDSLAEALGKMAADGVDEAIVSNTCLMQGGELARIREAVNSWAAESGRRARVTKPLLWAPEDRQAIARAVCDEFSSVPEGDVVLLMGHGSRDGSNEVYVQVQEEMHRLGGTRFFVGTVEGTPAFEDVWSQIEALEAGCVHLAPLMVVAGDHAVKDLAGEGEDSWASKIAARGLRVEAHLKGLGEYEAVQKLACDHVHQSLLMWEVALRG